MVSYQPPLQMAEETAIENGQISNFQGLVTLDRVLLHTVVHYSLTSTYMPNFIEIEGKNFLWTNVHWYGRTFETGVSKRK